MENHKLIKELLQINLRKGEIEREIREFLKLRAERLRQFSEGERVRVMSESDKFICEGIVGGVFIFPFESFQIRTFAENEEKYLTHINEIRYQVFAIKKNGEKSLHNATSSRSLGIKRSGYNTSSYIEKLT